MGTPESHIIADNSLIREPSVILPDHFVDITKMLNPNQNEMKY
jgi:hypothetical protein